jgi:hypothetical protein
MRVTWRDFGWLLAIVLLLGSGLVACAGATTGGFFGAGIGLGLSFLLMFAGVSTTQTGCEVGPCLTPNIDMMDISNPDSTPDIGPCLTAPFDAGSDVGPCLSPPLDIGPCLTTIQPDMIPSDEGELDAQSMDIGPCLTTIQPDMIPSDEGELDAQSMDIGPCLTTIQPDMIPSDEGEGDADGGSDDGPGFDIGPCLSPPQPEPPPDEASNAATPAEHQMADGQVTPETPRGEILKRLIDQQGLPEDVVARIKMRSAERSEDKDKT